MWKTLLAVVAGFALWSVLWLALNAVLGGIGLLPPPAEAARTPVTAPLPRLLLLAGSVAASLAAGYLAARAAPSAPVRAAVALGVLLLATGALVQASSWSLLPVWYHLAFLALLVPATLAGARAAAAKSAGAARGRTVG